MKSFSDRFARHTWPGDLNPGGRYIGTAKHQVDDRVLFELDHAVQKSLTRMVWELGWGPSKAAVLR